MGNQRGNILIVEDEAGPRDSLRMILKLNYNLHFAENGEQALDLLMANDFDLITLDLKLPDLTGLELLKEIKRQKPDVEVIIITGHGDLQSSMDAMKLGTSSYLLKPLNIGEVLSLVNQAVKKKRQIDRLKGFLTELGNLVGLSTEMGEGIRKLKEDQSLLEKIKRMFDQSPQEMEDQKKINYFDFIRNLIEVVEKEDPYANGHSGRVNYYSNLIACKLNLSDQEKEELQIGAYLHDIGKLGIDKRVIQKKKKYTAEEAKTMKRHPSIGISIVSPLKLSPNILSVIQHHHEFYDGSGYPDRCKGKDLTILPRIVAVADAFDAMISDYPYEYRKVLSMEEAVEELKACSGTQFDPEVVIAFTKIIEKEKDKVILKSSLFSSI